MREGERSFEKEEKTILKRKNSGYKEKGSHNPLSSPMYSTGKR